MFMSLYFEFVPIANKKTVSIPTSYGSYFFIGVCFANSALNSIGPLEDPPQVLWFKGFFLGCLVVGFSFIPKKEV